MMRPSQMDNLLNTVSSLMILFRLLITSVSLSRVSILTCAKFPS